MANNKADGSMWDKVIDANPLRDNGATVLMGGNIDSSATVTNAPNQSILGAGRVENSKPVESAYNGTTKSVVAGTFGVVTAGSYVVKGGNITTNLAGVAYRGLRGGGNPVQHRSPNTLLTRTTVLIDSWDYATGAPTYNASNPSSDDFDSGAYAEPTRALPGNLVIVDDGKTPTVVAYEEKTG